jgi:hypothetical protein
LTPTGLNLPEQSARQIQSGRTLAELKKHRRFPVLIGFRRNRIQYWLLNPHQGELFKIPCVPIPYVRFADVDAAACPPVSNGVCPYAIALQKII